MTKEKKKSLDNDINTVQNKVKKSFKGTTDKKYELVNFVSETGDSIFATPIGNSHNVEPYYAEDIVREMIREIVRQELVAAGVLKAA